MELDDQGRIVLNLADTNPGLENSDGLRVKVTSPIARTASGVDLTLATDPGLEDVSGLRVKAVAPLERTADGLELSLDATGGLLTVDSGNLAFSYDDTQGLDQVAGEQDPVQEAELIGWWKLDDGSGATAADSSTGSHDGTLTGPFDDGSGWDAAVPAVSPMVDSSLDFLSGDNYVKITEAGDLDIDPDGDDYTVMCWFKDVPDNANLVLKAGDRWYDTRGEFVLRVVPDSGGLNRIYLYIGNTRDDWTAASGTFDDGNWHHLAVSVHGTAASPSADVYLDGSLFGTQSSLGSYSGSHPWFIGGSDDPTLPASLNGNICDVRIYSTDLSAAEIADIAAGTESNVPDLLVVDLAATNPGLEFDGSGDLQVKVKASSGLTVDSDGLQVTAATARADSSQNAITLTSVTDPADAPADADALRDDLVANALAELQTRDGELKTAIETLAGEFNDLLSKLRTANLLDT
jgi:hypothetical protein